MRPAFVQCILHHRALSVCSLVRFFLPFCRRKKKCARLRPAGFRGLAEEDEDEDEEDCCIQDADPNSTKLKDFRRVQQPPAAASVLHLTSNPLITSMYSNSATSTITSPFLHHP